MVHMYYVYIITYEEVMAWLRRVTQENHACIGSEGGLPSPRKPVRMNMIVGACWAGQKCRSLLAVGGLVADGWVEIDVLAFLFPAI